CAVLASFAGSCVVFVTHNIEVPEFTWIDLRPVLNVPLGIILDDLSRTMLVLVCGVGALIHVYSLGYMRDDPGKSRYFACLSFFMFSMLGIVVANNFVMMFIFWELVGVSSYLLIGHWFERRSAAEAAKKAFLTNRVGDFGFMLGILMAWAATGSVVFGEMQSQIGRITSYPGYLTISALLIFCGAVGKSAQFPLHVWLPDAMEGPTPISALIHAATMVAAGVYMLVRVGFLFETSAQALAIISWIGTITAVMAALIATQQNDIKRILAYSTLSQLGYMIMAVGLASGQAAMFHLFTHAFFKALLFLGAGSIIVMLHHEQNIWKMGGLAGRLGITFLTFIVGTLALIGLPPFSGFFSKDAILALAYEKNRAIFWIGLFTAFLTAFYMLRLVVVVFFGKPRSDRARAGREAPWVMIGPLIILAVPALASGFAFVARIFVRVPVEQETGWHVPGMALGAALAGAFLAIFLYRGRAEEPMRVAPLRGRFYFDEIYSFLIAATQELLAKLSAFVDRWILDVIAIRGAATATWGIGSLLRLFQVGNLQAYAFLFGIGLVGLIYFTVFR
ncbi:MAG TPA: NADH-quinone oxidoreductase subunit L, partial [Chthoniobacterales bacterium]|nr:NADH-quinone oxidoreductase subunit L [Chthoniobacterales bacterium]